MQATLSYKQLSIRNRKPLSHLYGN